MNTKLIRSVHTDLEIRSDGRTVSGIAVPFATPTHITGWEGDFDEEFLRGAFARTIRERGDRVKFLAQHDSRTMPLGRATLLREDAAGLYSEFRVSKTQAGDEALELIRDGVLDALSIGFEVVTETWTRNRKHRTVTEAKLREISAVNFPAYDTARIIGVRTDGNVYGPEHVARAMRLLSI